MGCLRIPCQSDYRLVVHRTPDLGEQRIAEKRISVTASSTGLSNGVYNATLVFQATEASPQFVEVPVSFTVGPSTGIRIGGVTNRASTTSRLMHREWC